MWHLGPEKAKMWVKNGMKRRNIQDLHSKGIALF